MRYDRSWQQVARQTAPLAVLLLGFALRLHQLAAESLWLDELGQASVASGSLSEALAGAQRHHGAAPLDYLFTWLILQVAHADFAVRLPAAMFGTATVALMYRLGRTLFDDVVGLLAALLLAVAPLHLRYSQEARFYALFAFLALATTTALVVALRRNDRRGWAAYTLLVIAALYSHYFTPVVVLTQGIAVLLYTRMGTGDAERRHSETKSRLLPFLISCAIAAVAFLPWFFLAVWQETGNPAYSPPAFTAALVAEILAGLVGGPAGDEMPLWLPWLYVGLTLVGVVAGLARARTRWATLTLLLPLLLTPPLIILALTLVNYFFDVRQLLFLLPFLLLLVSVGATSAAGWLASQVQNPRGRPAVRALLILGAATALIWPLQPAIAGSYTTVRQNWRDALAFVRANAKPEDAIIVPRIRPDIYLRYYAAEWVDRIQGPATADQFDALVAQSPSGWIVLVPQAASFIPQVEALNPLPIHFAPNMSVFYYASGRNPEEILKASLDWDPPASAQALAQLARQYRAAGMGSAASDYFGLAAAKAWDDREASTMLLEQANTWRRLGEVEPALAGIEASLARWPANDGAWVVLGDLLLTRGEVDRATEALTQAARLAPDQYWAHRLLGQAYLAQGEAKKAAASLQRAVALDPAQAETYFLLAEALLGVEDSAGAVEAYQRYLEMAGDGRYAAKARDRLAELR